MTDEERVRILSNDYADLIVEYRGNPSLLEGYIDGVSQIMNEEYAIIYVPAAQLNEKVTNFLFAELPNVYGLTQDVNLEASGVSDIRNQPSFDLRGEGVLVAIIDTGIDYTNPVFIKEDGSTKVVAIWDQTIQTGVSPLNTYFGSEYEREDINLALASENPFDIVPSRDEVGHGTMMAAIAAGNEVPSEDFYGVAPNAELIVVKMREAKANLREFYRVPEGRICYQENHLMWGIQYCYYKARELGRPVVICMGSGTSLDGHDGRSPLCAMSDVAADTPNVVIVFPVGNEGNKGRHYYGVIDPSTGINTVEFNVSEEDKGFSMVLWGNSPGLFSIDILSPSGEYIPRIPTSIAGNREITFIFEATVINVNYQSIESQTGDELILLRFANVASGAWRINVYEQSGMAESFHIWLPMNDFISLETYFILPNIYTTLVSPSSGEIPISVTAYNPTNSNIYVNAGRGFTRGNTVKPELAAPGVNYIAPTANQTFATYTGTSVAAAHGAGIAALVLEWGSVRMNRPGMDSIGVKNFLIRGAIRKSNLSYPNRDWGYGIMNIYNAFNILREEF